MFSTSAVTVRQESVNDYLAIADIHYYAFENRQAEAKIVALHRQRFNFEPKLSLVAETGGHIVGHVLYTPRTFRVMGQDIRALILGPLGVMPEWQGRGVGSVLMRAGDDLARDLGYPFVVLLGHDTYYPRFGYVGNAFGFSSLTLRAGAALHLFEGAVEPRPVQAGDEPALMALWRIEEAGVDLSVVPDDDLSAWLSPNPRVTCSVYLRDDKIVGYTRVSADEPGQVRMFLARDINASVQIAATLGQGKPLVLPLHPRSGSARVLSEYGDWKYHADPHCMARALSPSMFDSYLALMRRGQRIPGRILWPAEFDV